MRKLPSKLASKLYGAAELIADRGLDATKIEDIAEATGIPKATLYYHLEGKNAVLDRRGWRPSVGHRRGPQLGR
ncbi:helix-turn-helix domain-containing protein [Nocardioides sp. KR10-350]|jgi:hypothetical protein|uniref:helix-turn-helix domain-containing protein n=1 Tax=Nocardioides cheoyonin TaxID=3156615 RepID=UPI0032B4E02E